MTFLSMALVAVACGTDSTRPAERGLALAWTSPTTVAGADWVGGTPAVDGGRVFVQEAYNLVALDAATGRRLWARRVRIAPAPGPTTLRADAGRVYLSETDSIMSIDAATGATIWTVHPDSQAVVVPALDATTFYTGQRGVPVVYAVNRSDGTVRWKVNLGAGFNFAAPVHGVAVSGDTVYAAIERYLDQNGVQAHGVLVALGARDGRELWRYETSISPSYFVTAPVPVGNLVIVNDFVAGDLVAVDVVTHQERWRTPAGGPTGAYLVGGEVLSVGSDHHARAIDVATGKLTWSSETDSSPFGYGVCGPNLYVATGPLRRYDANTGARTGEAGVGGEGAGFVSYVANDGTQIYATASSGVFAFRC